MTLRVVIADDQEMVRMGFALILQGAPDIEVVAQCSDGVEAIDAVRRLRPDVALLDIRMPRLDGLEAAAAIVDQCAVVIVTTFGDDDCVDAALAIGASGFLLKDSGPSLLVAAVRAAARGDALISPELTVELLRRTGAKGGHHPLPGIARLSPRELDVTRLVARGLTNAEIAESLFVTVGTVKTHLSNISARLGARNRVEIAAAAWQSGLMEGSSGGSPS